MASPHAHRCRHTPTWSTCYDVRLILVVAACLLIEAVVAKKVLDVGLDYLSQTAALWILIAYWVDRSTAHAFGFAAVAVTAAALALHAL
jgi:hypothetical protein